MNIPCCPICRKNSSSLLFDTYPDLFEESYNWLNCHSLPPPQPQEDSYVPEDAFEQINFGELYVDDDELEPTKLPTSLNRAVQDKTMVDESLRRSLRNHLLEYQVWKDSIKDNDKRVIWWVCSQNPEHVWRESVRSRIKSECPFCRNEQMQKKRSTDRLIETGSGKLVTMQRRSKSPVPSPSEEEMSYTLYEPYSCLFQINPKNGTILGNHLYINRAWTT